MPGKEMQQYFWNGDFIERPYTLELNLHTHCPHTEPEAFQRLQSAFEERGLDVDKVYVIDPEHATPMSSQSEFKGVPISPFGIVRGKSLVQEGREIGLPEYEVTVQIYDVGSETAAIKGDMRIFGTGTQQNSITDRILSSLLECFVYSLPSEEEIPKEEHE
jgi:hypothetical protein